MTKQSDQFNPEENLAFISGIIKNTQGNFQKTSFYFLLWGWVVVLANLGHYYLMVHTTYQHPYIVWLITIPAWIITIIHAYRQGKTARVTTHLDRVIGMLWFGFGISVLLLVILGMPVRDYFNPIILLMVAIPTVITGYTIRFKPLIIGGIGFWIFGVVLFQVSSDLHYLITPGAIIIGYLIPGHLLRQKEQ